MYTFLQDSSVKVLLVEIKVLLYIAIIIQSFVRFKITLFSKDTSIEQPISFRSLGKITSTSNCHHNMKSQV